MRPALPPVVTEADRLEALSRIAATRSLAVIRRFLLKVGFFAGFAGLHAAVGHDFLQTLSTLALASAVLAIVLGQWRQDRVDAPHYTSFDEAAWFMLLACATSQPV